MTSKRRQAGLAASLYELFSSMRFAIGLLTILAVASVIGTVLKQNEPYANYVFEFGSFWFEVYRALGLFDVYHSAWFLLILVFLVVSTALCIWRNTPGFLKEMKAFRERASGDSLAAMSHSAVIVRDLPADGVEQYLKKQGFSVRRLQRDDGLMLAAKKGAGNKLGYFCAHIALVVICIGGLIDGNVPLKVAELFGRASPEVRDVPQSQVPEQSRLGDGNLSFRGNVTLPEKQSADVVFLSAGNGYFVQELPFIVTLKQFHVDYYPSGMPKRFASDVVVTDKQSGKETAATIEVNHPLTINGVSIYQASFGDGGSGLDFSAWDLSRPQDRPVALKGKSMNSQPLVMDGKRYTLEFGEFRPFNVESIADNSAMGVKKNLEGMLAEAGRVDHEKQVRNLGPSIQFKLRDAQGQAIEYMTYMAPIQLEGRSYIVSGVRTEVNGPMSFLRFPLDADGRLDGFMRLKNALQNPALYGEVARRAAAKAEAGGAIDASLAHKFAGSVEWVLARFSQQGFAGLENFLDEKVPEDKKQAVAQTYVKILQGAIIDLQEVARRQAGLAALPMDEAGYRFLLDSLVAYSASRDYGSPLFLQLSGFDQLKASGLQMTRSPGKNVVYFGSLLLVIGILFMFYVRELRLWVLIRPDGSSRVAMSSNRKTRDLDSDFDRHRDAIEHL